MRLLLLLFLNGHLFAKEAPDVDCVVVHLKYVNCSWNKPTTPEVNYTFYSRFYHDKEFTNCTNYVSENSMTTGCHQPYKDLKDKRFDTFYTQLVHGNRKMPRTHFLKEKVLFFPPVNLTVQKESDSNLWLYWNQTASAIVQSEVRFRFNNNWETSLIRIGMQSLCINFPFSNSQYEFQVRSKLGKDYGGASLWSDWSESVFWGSNSTYKHTDDTKKKRSASVWIPVVLGIITLVILVILLLHCERIRIIPIPVVSQASLIHGDIESWFQNSKGLRFENFKVNYNERVCPVSEYSQVSKSDSVSSDGSTCSVTNFQVDCSVSMPANKPEDPSAPCSPSTSTVNDSSEQEHPISD